MASWKERKYDIYGDTITLNPGQFITSYSEIKKLTGKDTSIRNVRTGIDRFEKLGFLTREVTRRGSLITIVNWQKYQDKNYESDKETDIELTSHRQATDKALTSDRHAHKKTKKPCNQVTKKPSNKNTSPLNPPEGKEEERKEDSVSLPIPGYAFNTMTHNYPGLTDTLQRLGINEVGEVNAILRLSDYGRKGTTVWRLIANTCWSDIGAKGRYLIAALNRAKRK